MKIKIVKMNNRHKGSPHFKYYASIEKRRYNTYEEAVYTITEMRTWCWENFGPSLTIEELVILKFHGYDVDKKWAWMDDSGYSNHRFYFLDDDTLAWFIMRWSE